MHSIRLFVLRWAGMQQLLPFVLFRKRCLSQVPRCCHLNRNSCRYGRRCYRGGNFTIYLFIAVFHAFHQVFHFDGEFFSKSCFNQLDQHRVALRTCAVVQCPSIFLVFFSRSPPRMQLFLGIRNKSFCDVNDPYCSLSSRVLGRRDIRRVVLSATI